MRLQFDQGRQFCKQNGRRNFQQTDCKEEKNVLIKTAKSNLNQIFVYKSETHLHQKTVNIDL